MSQTLNQRISESTNSIQLEVNSNFINDSTFKNQDEAQTERIQYTRFVEAPSYAEIYNDMRKTEHSCDSKRSYSVTMQALEDTTKSKSDNQIDTCLVEEFYPIFLPIDQKDFREIYGFTRKSHKKSLQDRTYNFLEHPVGWACFLYHFGV